MVAGQQQQPQPPNLVISGAPLQPEFGAGISGATGRMANHPIVVAGGNPSTEPVQFSLVSAPCVSLCVGDHCGISSNVWQQVSMPLDYTVLSESHSGSSGVLPSMR